MDLDFNDVFNAVKFAVYATDGRHSVQAAAAPPRPARTGHVVCNAALPAPASRTTYDDLPPEVIQQIASYLSCDDIAQLSALNQRSYGILRERRLAWRNCRRAETVVDLASLQQLLDDTQDLQFEPSLRTDPVVALWYRLPWLPAAERPEAFKRLFRAADGIPRHGHVIQQLMIVSIAQYAPQQRVELFDFVQAIAEQHRNGHQNLWASLASTLSCLPLGPSQFAARYQALLGRLPSLGQTQQAELIAVLAAQLSVLRDSSHGAALDVSMEYGILQDWTRRLPPSLQGAPVGALAAAVSGLPDAQRPFRYADMQQLALGLPSEQLMITLQQLLLGLATLPAAQHANKLSMLESALLRTPPPVRIQAVHRLIETTPRLHGTLSRQIWQRALRLLDGSDTNGVDALEVLDAARRDGVINMLGKGQRQNAVRETIAFVQRNHLTKQAGAALLACFIP
ncbi:F-box protein (plasmid) [Mycetohabitans endofungorum]|uniref:F-box protein n=1 Tax=Mycetohabitans endofungorum TaxID=417203 RepID=UPI0030CD44D9